ncbi:MAG: M20/M25/M40 family metallo-hydrolase [bacterium]
MDIVNLLISLIRYKTIERNKDQLKQIVDFCRGYLEGNSLLRFDIFEVNGKWNLIADYGVDVEVYFVAHLDVVDANDEQFEPLVDGDRVIGRGALDMKGPASTLIHMFRNLNDKKYPIGLILTTDEEVGSHDGVKYIIQNKKINTNAKMAVIPDGGENFKIITKGKGAFHFVAKAKGVSCHGSTPWNGVNAIDNIINFYISLKQALLLNEKMDDPDHWHNTVNIGKIEGGQKVNIVAPHASAHIDIRFTEKFSLEEISSIVYYYAKKFDIDIEVLSTGQPVIARTDSPYFIKFIDSYKSVIGEPKYAVEHGATDGRFFASMGIDVITIYPVGAGIHSEYEWVSIQSLHTMSRLFHKFVDSLV